MNIRKRVIISRNYDFNCHVPAPFMTENDYVHRPIILTGMK